MPGRQTPIRIPKAVKAADVAAARGAQKKGGGAKAPSTTETKLRAKIKELEADKAFLKQIIRSVQANVRLMK